MNNRDLDIQNWRKLLHARFEATHNNLLETTFFEFLRTIREFEKDSYTSLLKGSEMAKSWDYWSEKGNDELQNHVEYLKIELNKRNNH